MEKEELDVLKKTIACFQSYSGVSGSQLKFKLQSLTKHQQPCCEQDSFKPILAVKERVRLRLLNHLPCIRSNQMLLNSIVERHLSGLDIDDKIRQSVTPADHDKLVSTLRQFVRDWSDEGQLEREATYTPILKSLDDYYKSTILKTNPEKRKYELKVLVPGAGLGRLVFEIVRNGYSCQGNEFSFYMLLCSDYILNIVTEPKSIPIHPWIHSFSNTHSESEQVREIRIPDVAVCAEIESMTSAPDFSMVGGDFIEVYGQESQHGQWDVIVTCFFLDTAQDMANYIFVISNALKPGGLWVNMGPLQYHFEGMAKEASIEYTLEEVMTMVEAAGFTISRQETCLPATYTCNRDGMLHYIYRCCHFSAIKT